MDLVLFRPECDRAQRIKKLFTYKKKFKLARQHDSKLVGTVGNLIFYNFRGEYYMRAKPVSVKRTKASVNSGFNFGKASKIGKQVRGIIQQINPSKSDQRMIYRVTGVLNKWLRWMENQDASSPNLQKGLPFIKGFQFNDQADLTSISAIQVSVKSTESGMLEISLAPFIPSQSLHAPYNTYHILFKMILTGTDLATIETETLGTAEIQIPYISETFQPPVVFIPAAAKPGHLIIMVMAVQYMVNKNDGIEMLHDKKKLHCGVAWAGLR